MMALFERSLIFFPTRYPTGIWDVSEAAAGSGCTLEDCFFEAEDGVRLHAWWCRPEAAGENPPVLLFFHGNAGNLSDRGPLVFKLAREIGAEVLVLGYRGYGRSEGRPSEDGIFLDARAAWSYLVSERAIDPRRIVIFGKSLGGAVAVDLALEAPAAGLIVESSFTSIPDMARDHYRIVPRFMVRTKMNSLAKVPEITIPKLFIHSKADQVVPYPHGQKLFEAASEPKAFYEVAGAGHNETWIVGGRPYFDALSSFVNGRGQIP